MTVAPFDDYKPEVCCVHCGGEMLHGESGVLCSVCITKIIPLEIYKGMCEKSERWKKIRKIGQRAFRKWWGGRESRTVRDNELAKLGLRQPELF